MDTVARPPRSSILEAISGAWYHRRCTECNEPVGYEWQPRPGDLDAAWADESLFRTRCAACVLATVEALDGPPEEAVQRAALRRSLRERYALIRQVWTMAGLRDDDDAAFYTPEQQAMKRQQVRQVLQLVAGRRPVLTMGRWYPPGKGTGLDDPYLELFMIHGELPVASRASVIYHDFAAFPRYLISESERDGRREVHASLLLAMHACYPPALPTEIRWRWNPLLPDVDLPPTIHLLGHCTPEDLGRLASHAQRLFATVDPRGRKRNTGRYPRGDEDRFLRDVEAVLAVRERDGVTLTRVEMLADAMGMSRSAFFEVLRRVPEARERYWEHQRRLPRR